MLHEYQGVLNAPDKITDPIGHALWLEANQCPECRGTGKRIPKSCAEAERMAGRKDRRCPCCSGRGVIPEMFDPSY